MPKALTLYTNHETLIVVEYLYIWVVVFMKKRVRGQFTLAILCALILSMNSHIAASVKEASSVEEEDFVSDDSAASPEETQIEEDEDNSTHDQNDTETEQENDADLDVQNNSSRTIKLSSFTKPSVPSKPTYSAIADKSASPSPSSMPAQKTKPTLVAIEQEEQKRTVYPADKPVAIGIYNSEADKQALSMLQIADNHRNHRTHFSEAEALKEAARLYTEVDTSTLAISPDIRARAKINLIELTVWSPFEHATAEKKVTALNQFIAITQGKEYSADTIGWAKRHLAKIYLFGDFELEPAHVKAYALAILTETIANSSVSLETRMRATIQLAQHYIHAAFDVSEKVALENANKLLQGVYDNKDVRPELRAEAKLIRACITNPYEDLANKKRLQLLREIIVEKNISASITAKAKERLAYYYLTKTFDVPLMEARKQAHELLKDLEDDELTPKEKLYYYLHLASHYLHIKLDLKPSESRAAAFKMYKDLQKNLDLNIDQYYDYKMELAYYYVTNAFGQDPEKAQDAAVEIYQELLKNNALSLMQKANVYWTLASLYINNQLPTETGANGKTEGLSLINKIITDPATNYVVANQFKLNLAILMQNNALGLLPSKAAAEAVRLLTELVNDTRISAADKQLIQMRLDATANK